MIIKAGAAFDHHPILEQVQAPWVFCFLRQASVVALVPVQMPALRPQ